MPPVALLARGDFAGLPPSLFEPPDPGGTDAVFARVAAPTPVFGWTLDCERVLAGGVSSMRILVEESWRPSAAAGRGRGGRFSAGRKREVVMRLLRGEDLESVSRAVGITAARASHWRAVSGCGLQAGLKSRATDARDEDHRRLQAKIGECDGDRVAVCEGGPAGGQRPFGPAEVDAMSGAQSISTRRAHAAGLPRVALRPLQRVCEASGDPVPGAVSSPRSGRRRPDDVLVAHRSSGARSLAVAARATEKCGRKVAG